MLHMQASGGWLLQGWEDRNVLQLQTVITTMPATPYTAVLYNSNARRLFQTQEFM